MTDTQNGICSFETHLINASLIMSIKRVILKESLTKSIKVFTCFTCRNTFYIVLTKKKSTNYDSLAQSFFY